MGFFNDISEGMLGGVPIIGDAYTAKKNREAQSDANQQNIASAREQMEFQERLSNTAYQRSMSDMRTAGLNPMLAYSQGGASVPSGSMANVAALPTVAGGWNTGMNKAKDALMAGVGAQNQTKSTDSTVRLQQQQAVQSAEQAKKLSMETIKTEAETRKTLQDLDQSANTFEDRKGLLKLERKMKQTDEKWQEPEKYIKSGSQVIDSVTGVAGKFLKGFLRPDQSGNSGKRPPKSDTKHYYDRNGEHTGSVETNYNR